MNDDFGGEGSGGSKRELPDDPELSATVKKAWDFDIDDAVADAAVPEESAWDRVDEALERVEEALEDLGEAVEDAESSETHEE